MTKKRSQKISRHSLEQRQCCDRTSDRHKTTQLTWEIFSPIPFTLIETGFSAWLGAVQL